MLVYEDSVKGSHWQSSDVSRVIFAVRVVARSSSAAVRTTWVSEVANVVSQAVDTRGEFAHKNHSAHASNNVFLKKDIAYYILSVE
jgi:hypothetical protein